MADIYGWSFPIEIDGNTGRIKEVWNEELIHQSIEMILKTNINERILFQNFGCGLRRFVFSTFEYSTYKQVENEVIRSLTLWEPRIELLYVTAKLDSSRENVLRIEIGYKIINLEAEFRYFYEVKVE